jgi:predicted DNA-binding WGR domain protein
MRIYMQSAADTQQLPRFYQIHLEKDLLEGWLLVKEWGHQGSPGRVKKEHFKSAEEAQQAALATRDAQLKRGYRVVFIQGEKFTT